MRVVEVAFICKVTSMDHFNRIRNPQASFLSSSISSQKLESKHYEQSFTSSTANSRERKDKVSGNSSFQSFPEAKSQPMYTVFVLSVRIAVELAHNAVLGSSHSPCGPESNARKIASQSWSRLSRFCCSRPQDLCVKNFDQPINSFDLEGKAVSQSTLTFMTDPLQFCETGFDGRPRVRTDEGKLPMTWIFRAIRWVLFYSEIQFPARAVAGSLQSMNRGWSSRWSKVNSGN
jgi:hypothetical protein